MGVVKSIPSFVKVGRRKMTADFVPSSPAWNYDKHRGKTGVLYVLETNGHCKIGVTTDFEKRFRALSAGMPTSLRKVCIRTVPRAGLVYAEAWLHKQFDAERLHGEWFAALPAEILKLMPEAVRLAGFYDQACREWFELDRRR